MCTPQGMVDCVGSATCSLVSAGSARGADAQRQPLSLHGISSMLASAVSPDSSGDSSSLAHSALCLSVTRIMQVEPQYAELAEVPVQPQPDTQHIFLPHDSASANQDLMRLSYSDALPQPLLSVFKGSHVKQLWQQLY